MNKKKFAEVLEAGVINNLNLGRGIYEACEACGNMTEVAQLETVLFDEERFPAKVCPKCYFGAEERADEVYEQSPRDEALESIERTNCKNL